MAELNQTPEQIAAEVSVNAAEARLYDLQADEQALNNYKLSRGIEIEDCADILHNYIQFDEDVNEISVSSFKAQLRRIVRRTVANNGDKKLVIELNTPGGSIVDGFAMLDDILHLRKQGWHVTIRVLGQAASMGAVLLQGADVREVGENSLVMIHRAAFGAIGKAYEIEDELEFVKKLEGKIATVFAKASGRPVDDFKFLFDKRRDIWFDGAEAVEAGLADRIC